MDWLMRQLPVVGWNARRSCPDKTAWNVWVPKLFRVTKLFRVPKLFRVTKLFRFPDPTPRFPALRPWLLE